MLKKFSVENFKGFRDKLVFDIGSPNNYSFNSNIIENGCVTKGIVYGINSCGKSNLGLAIFDIITHLTEKEKLLKTEQSENPIDNFCSLRRSLGYKISAGELFALGLDESDTKLRSVNGGGVNAIDGWDDAYEQFILTLKWT